MSPLAHPLPCFQHTATDHIFCGPQDLLLHTFDSTGHKSELISLPCDTTAFSDHTKITIIDPVNNDNWESYLNTEIPVVIQSRSAEAEPEPYAEAEAEAEAELVDHMNLLEARKKKPSTSSVSSGVGSSAAGRVVVSGLGLWIALGWIVVGAAPW